MYEHIHSSEHIIILLYICKRIIFGVLDIEKSSPFLSSSGFNVIEKFSVVRRSSSVVDLQLGEQFANVCQFYFTLFLSWKREFCSLLRIHQILLFNSHLLWLSEVRRHSQVSKSRSLSCFLKKTMIFPLITTFAVSPMSHEMSHLFPGIMSILTEDSY